MAKNNRQRILDAGIELFNQSGTVATTTNHIARHLSISPGNLYFHFKNREAIVLELFERHCESIYEAWNSEKFPALGFLFDLVNTFAWISRLPVSGAHEHFIKIFSLIKVGPLRGLELADPVNPQASIGPIRPGRLQDPGDRPLARAPELRWVER